MAPAGEPHRLQPPGRGFAAASLLAAAAVVSGAAPAWPGVVHLVALPPLDLAADVRVVMAEATSLGTAVAATAAATTARVVLLALYLGSLRRHVGFALRFYLAALPLATLAAALDFAGRAALYAWFSWAGLAVLVVLFMLMGSAPWDGTGRLRPRSGGAALRGRMVPILAGYVVTLTVIGAAAPRGHGVLAALPLSAALTWQTARQLAASGRAARWLAGATALAGAATVVAALAAPLAGTSAGTTVRRPGSLLLVPGVATASGKGALYRLDPRQLGYSCDQTFYYSYAGPGRGTARGNARCPIRAGAPYSGRDTGRPLPELVAGFTQQLAALPGPVAIVTHSQGAWVAWEALATPGPRPPVTTLVMLGPFAHTQATYPPPGTNGPGYAGGAVLRALVALARRAGFTTFDPDAPLTRALHATPGAIDRVFARRLPPGIAAAAVESRWDLPLGRNAWPGSVVQACPVPVTHTGLTTARAAMRMVRAVLEHEPLGSCRRWASWIARAAAPFGVPGATRP